MNKPQNSISIGSKIGRWTIICKAEKQQKGTYWSCECECGERRAVRGSALTAGKSISCGCFSRDQRRGIATNGTMNSWSAMKSRCEYEKNKLYSRYGGRGIKICEHLSESSSNLAALIGNRPNGLSIDRINNDGHYSCGTCHECIDNAWEMNVRWATRYEQQRNTSKNRHLTMGGETKCLSDWARLSGLRVITLWQRIEGGWPESRLLIPPLRPTTHKHTSL
jgi:hypothetical protein